MKKLNCGITILAASVLGSAVAPAEAQQEIKLTICAQAPVFPFVRMLSQVFIPAVNRELAKQGKVKIAWNEAYGNTLAKLGSELEGVEQGVCDVGSVATVFHTAKIPLQVVSFVTPFGTTDPRVLTKVMNGLNEKMPAFKKAWEKQNQVYLVGYAVDDYGIVSTTPLARMEDLNGKKLASSPLPLSWLKGTGASGVVSGLPSYYNDTKSGVYSGILTFISATTPIKLHEVAPHFAQAGMGAMFPGALTVNKQRWDRVGPEVQAALKLAAVEFTDAYSKDLFVRTANSLEAFKAGGGKITVWSDAERVRMAQAIENPTKSWAAQAEKAGQPAREVLKVYMSAMRAEGVKFARDWDRE